MSMSIFRRSRVVVVSQSNRNCDIGLIENTATDIEYTQNIERSPTIQMLRVFKGFRYAHSIILMCLVAF